MHDVEPHDVSAFLARERISEARAGVRGAPRERAKGAPGASRRLLDRIRGRA
jgi:hypothetical protein